MGKKQGLERAGLSQSFVSWLLSPSHLEILQRSAQERLTDKRSLSPEEKFRYETFPVPHLENSAQRPVRSVFYFITHEKEYV